MAQNQAKVIITPAEGGVIIKVVVGNATGKDWGEMFVSSKDCENLAAFRDRVLDGLRTLKAPEGASVIGAPPLPKPKAPDEVFERWRVRVPLPGAVS